jgi:hypothetical protein
MGELTKFSRGAEDTASALTVREAGMTIEEGRDDGRAQPELGRPCGQTATPRRLRIDLPVVAEVSPGGGMVSLARLRSPKPGELSWSS